MARAPLPNRLTTAPFTVRQAAALSVPTHRLRAADLTTPFCGIRWTREATMLEDWCVALLPRLTPHQVFSHATAAALWGLPLPEDETLPLHVSALRGREPRVRGVVGHRVQAERVERWSLGGLPVVSAADAWCQVAGDLAHGDLVALGDALVGWPAPLLTLEQVDSAIARHRGGRGWRAIRRARGDLRPGSASRRETLLRLELLAAGFPEPELNAPIVTAHQTLVGDLVFREWKVLVEYDGDHHRTDRRQFARDLERHNALAIDGWLVIRVGSTSVGTLEAVERALRARGWRQ